MGTFTIHHNAKIPIEEVGDKAHIAKYTIPAKFSSIILDELKLLGITRFSMFPELSSVGRIISESLR
jgi:hypothetical protein